MTEKLRTIIAASLTAAILVAAALVPLAFRDRAETVEKTGLDAGERAALFAEYWSGNGDVKSERIEKPSKSSVEACEKLMDDFVEKYTLDEELSGSDTRGSEYTLISGENGDMRICRMWMQYKGDWQNWMDMCFDMDTGSVYYFYMSSECLFNGNRYLGKVEGGLDAAAVADKIAEELRLDLEYLDWSGKSEDAATAVYITNGRALRLSINCIYYESTLIDVKVCCI